VSAVIERLEVLPGLGTVVRAGDLAGWAAPSASPALVSFLVQSARNLAGSATAARRVADHLAGVLEGGDPEPGVAFALVGPSAKGWDTLLHGAVHAWDGASWVSPETGRGWLRCVLEARPSITVSLAGTTAPPPSPDDMWDLEAGVVPGGGFVLVPSPPVPPSAGMLVTDEGAVYVLDRDYLLGSDPPTCADAAPLRLEGPGAAPVHAAVRVDEDRLVVADRGSSTGTYVYQPGGSAWEKVPPCGEAVVSPGGHVAVGQRVVTFVAQDPDTLDR
jgi:hypothetical protein